MTWSVRFEERESWFQNQTLIDFSTSTAKLIFFPGFPNKSRNQVGNLIGVLPFFPAGSSEPIFPTRMLLSSLLFAATLTHLAQSNHFHKPGVQCNNHPLLSQTQSIGEQMWCTFLHNSILIRKWLHFIFFSGLNKSYELIMNKIIYWYSLDTYGTLRLFEPPTTKAWVLTEYWASQERFFIRPWLVEALAVCVSATLRLPNLDHIIMPVKNIGIINPI